MKNVIVAVVLLVCSYTGLGQNTTTVVNSTSKELEVSVYSSVGLCTGAVNLVGGGVVESDGDSLTFSFVSTSFYFIEITGLSGTGLYYNPNSGTCPSSNGPYAVRFIGTGNVPERIIIE